MKFVDEAGALTLAKFADGEISEEVYTTTRKFQWWFLKDMGVMPRDWGEEEK